MTSAIFSPTHGILAQASRTDAAALFLRASMGVLLVPHAWMEIAVFTPAGNAQHLASLGLPGVLGHLTITAELLGGLASTVGAYARWVSPASVPLMAGATWFGHGSAGFFSNAGGGWEYPAFRTVALLLQALLGGRPRAGRPIGPVTAAPSSSGDHPYPPPPPPSGSDGSP